MDPKKSTSFTVALSLFVLSLSFLFPASAGAADTSKKMVRTTTFVGGDLHTLTYTKNGLFVTGHEAGSYSTDQGFHWKSISSIKNVDVMSWASMNASYLAGGHNGLFKSVNGGKTFTRIKFFGKASDVHALGAVNQTVYMGSPQVGFLRSVNGGKSWKVVNNKFGQGFMGSMLVDPLNPLRVIAPDMNNGLVITTDGGKTWSRFGGPSGVMSIAWNVSNTKEIVALGMEIGGLTKDGGKSWSGFSVPVGSSAIALSPTGSKIYVAILANRKAKVLSSTNFGKSWA